MNRTAIYALTPQGARLGKVLADRLVGDLFLPYRLAEEYRAIPFYRLMEVVARNFSSYPRQVFIAAAGIVVRVISPHLKRKDCDPAVIVLDHQGRYVISLLSGHLGRANELAREIALLTGGEAVITTATDVAGVPSIDLLASEKGFIILNIDAIKSVNMAILTGEPVQIFDPESRLCLMDHERMGFNVEQVAEKKDWVKSKPGIWVTWKDKRPDPITRQLILHPRCLVAGIGCNRGTDSREIVELIRSTFRENALALHSLKCLSTIDAKRGESGLREAAQQLGVPLSFASPSELKSIRVPHPSRVVEKHVGVSSVCEAAALLKSGSGRLLVPKTRSLNATLAVALEG